MSIDQRQLDRSVKKACDDVLHHLKRAFKAWQRVAPIDQANAGRLVSRVLRNGAANVDEIVALQEQVNASVAGKVSA